jgi:hypothetical protein
MTTNQPERKPGFYWVLWGAAPDWEPAMYRDGAWMGPHPEHVDFHRLEQVHGGRGIGN